MHKIELDILKSVSFTYVPVCYLHSWLQAVSSKLFDTVDRQHEGILPVVNLLQQTLQILP